MEIIHAATSPWCRQLLTGLQVLFTCLHPAVDQDSLAMRNRLSRRL